MLALDRALATLEMDTGFSRAFDDIVVRRGGWPNRWLTPEQINHELEGRGFWKGSRRSVNADSRVRLVQRYLDARVEMTQADGDSWTGKKGGSSLLGGSSGESSGGSCGGSSFLPTALAEGRRAGDVPSEWKRFDGQYKHNPHTKLIEYRGAKASRSFDRRAYLRVTVEKVSCQYGPVLNLSPMGLMFSTDDEPKMNSGDRGFLRIVHSQTSLRVRAKVIQITTTPLGSRVGVDFRGLTDDDRQTIAKIIADAGDPDDDSLERRGH